MIDSFKTLCFTEDVYWNNYNKNTYVRMHIWVKYGNGKNTHCRFTLFWRSKMDFKHPFARFIGLNPLFCVSPRTQTRIGDIMRMTLLVIYVQFWKNNAHMLYKCPLILSYFDHNIASEIPKIRTVPLSWFWLIFSMLY